MTVVVENSPRRFSLLNSNGANDPPPLANDLALTLINSPTMPLFVVEHLHPLFLYRILVLPQQAPPEFNLKSMGLLLKQKTLRLTWPILLLLHFPFNPVTQNSGTVNYEFEVLLVNGVADQRPQNSLLTCSTSVPSSTSLPVSEVFNSIPITWSIYNPDAGIQWSLRNTSTNGNAMYVNCYDYENEGAIDRFITPVLGFNNSHYSFS
jgi:hypothetical protein